jgi:hypothetical protein
MLKEIAVIDNFFKEPEKIVTLALKQNYYTVKEHPHDYENTAPNIFYNGRRTLSLKNILDKEICENINQQILTTLFKTHIREESEINISSDISCLFHSLFEDDQYDPRNMHEDSVIYAGIVYLNPKLDSDKHGTIVKNVTIPYKFNRLVIYRSDFMHCALNGYGNDIADSRLTLNIFINKIEISIAGTIVSHLQ